MVYRQSTGSRIAVNAALIRHGTLALEYGPDFTLIESGDFEHSADILETLYLQQVQELGMDMILSLQTAHYIMLRRIPSPGIYAP